MGIFRSGLHKSGSLWKNEETMKVLHLVSFYTPAFQGGGPILSIHNLNKWLVKKGVQVTVFTTNLDGASGNLNVPLSQPVDIDGVIVWYFPVVFFKKFEYSRGFHKKFAEAVSQFDIIHIDSIFRATSILGGHYARKCKKPHLISPRGSLMKEPLKKKSSLKKKIYLALIEKRNLAGADAIHFTVEREKTEYEERGLPLKKSIVIPNGLDPTVLSEEMPSGFFRSKFGIDRDKKIVLFLSRINWKKGLDTLIPAFAMVKKNIPEATLVIAGSDDEGYQKKVENMINENNLKESEVIFTGMLLGEDKVAAFRESDVFALPSYSENFGMAVLEAMYFGLPVVITPEVGISGEVKEFGAGIVVSKKNEEVSAAILKIISDKKFAEETGIRGRELVKKTFLMPAIAEKWLEEYHNLASNDNLK